jgi:uncharacterized membrane protein YbhN (UPF0104 family)
MSDATRSKAPPAPSAPGADPAEPVGAPSPTLDQHRLPRRLIGAVLVVAVMISLLLALPPLRHVATAIEHMSPAWLAVALLLELASGASFVIIFRHFFDRVPASAARELAWTEMGTGALLPGGGLGAYAAGGWLLHRAGLSPRRIVERSSGLFFLTSATNVAAMASAGIVLALGVGGGPRDFPHAVLPIIGAAIATAVVLALPVLCRGQRIRQSWLRDLLSGIRTAERALIRPGWRLLGAAGYLGFDIAVLWVTFAATSHRLPVAALVLAYLIGYLANLIPIPGGVGVLEGGLAGMLIVYGAPAAQAAAAVLVYHAIAFWIPSLGGLAAYWRLHCRLRDASTASIRAVPAPPSPQTVAVDLSEPCGLRRRPAVGAKFRLAEQHESFLPRDASDAR